MLIFFCMFVVLIIEAIHNKDYSVVKTFGLPLVHYSGGIFLSKYYHIPKNTFQDKIKNNI